MIAKTKLDIMDGRTALGIEFGSTRIKAVLIGSDLVPIAAGGFEWRTEFGLIHLKTFGRAYE
jgi:activator of 2-hydroxyglutaryl-CoA dehydratase